MNMKLGDFGLAEATQRLTTNVSLAGGQAGRGTVNYMVVFSSYVCICSMVTALHRLCIVFASPCVLCE